MVTRAALFNKIFLSFKNGQKKCPKSKSKKNFPDNILKNRYFMFSIIKIKNTNLNHP